MLQIAKMKRQPDRVADNEALKTKRTTRSKGYSKLRIFQATGPTFIFVDLNKTLWTHAAIICDPICLF